jgi:hypothetical protein
MISTLANDLISINEETIYNGIYYNHYNTIERNHKSERKIFDKSLARIYLICQSYINNLEKKYRKNALRWIIRKIAIRLNQTLRNNIRRIKSKNSNHIRVNERNENQVR